VAVRRDDRLFQRALTGAVLAVSALGLAACGCVQTAAAATRPDGSRGGYLDGSRDGAASNPLPDPVADPVQDSGPGRPPERAKDNKDGSSQERRGAAFDLPAGPLAVSLKAISRRFDVNVLFSSGDVEALGSSRVRGAVSARAALEAALGDAPLGIVAVDGRTFALAPVAPALAPGPSAPAGAAAAAHNRIIVTGTRVRDRTSFESLAPIDVISSLELRSTASDELLDSLSQTLPSFIAFRFPLNDGNIFNRPASLRGLNADHTLVLVNGKRRHRSAFLETSNGQAVDITQIPINAVKRVEVLRDGAAAQYGSDAIAGVINVILDDAPGFSAFGQYSTYYKGDGQSWRGGLKAGAAIGRDGFGVFSVEYFDNDRTSRSRQRADAIAFQAANPDLDVPDPVQNWGQPAREGWRIAWNADVPLSATIIARSFGTLGETDGLSDFNWRNPDTTSAYAPSGAFPDFDLRDVYPTGFTPQFGQEELDVSAFAGVAGDHADGFRWELSAGFGRNRIDYVFFDTVNPSLGPQSPTSFRPGVLQQSEQVVNLDLARAFGRTAGRPTNIAAGAEFRNETYEIGAGDPASFAVGPGAADGLPSGSNGFPGYTDEQAGRFTQHSVSAYVDIEHALTDRWKVALAGRYENYSLFDDTVNGKLSMRYDVTPDLALRGTVSTGFRAPTAGQVFSERTSQFLDAATLDNASSGRFSPVGPVAVILNERPDVDIEPLRPEKSTNYSAGLAFRAGRQLTLTVDGYQIDVRDRFGRTGDLFLTPAEQARLRQIDASVSSFVREVDFNQNVFDTRTRGVDVVATHRRDLGSGRLSLVGAYNYNNTRVTDADNVGDAARPRLLTNPFVRRRASATASYDRGGVSVFGRIRYYGAYRDESGQSEDDFQTFGAEAYVDIGGVYAVTDEISLRAGVENLFDNYPDEARRQANRGLIYSRNSPYDTDGGLFYVRIDAAF